MRSAAVQESVVIRQYDPNLCKFCDSANVAKDSIRHFKKGDVRQFKCKDCKKRFTRNLGFEGKHATAEQITMAVDLVFSGLSARKTADAIKGMNVKISHRTVMNWAGECGRLMDKFMDAIKPQVGEKWRTDEIYIKIRGERKYLFALLDSETRFWLAKMVAEHKGNDDMEPMSAKAKQVAGKVPAKLVSDGASNFAHAYKKQYAQELSTQGLGAREAHPHGG